MAKLRRNGVADAIDPFTVFAAIYYEIWCDSTFSLGIKTTEITVVF